VGGHLAVLLVSLVVLVKSADYLVEYAARLARRFQVSDLMAGLIVTSVGTSLPELASSLSAAAAGSSGLVIGNVVGSNIANIGLVLGSAALVRPFATDVRMHDRDGFILLASALVLFAAALDNGLGRLDAALFLGLYGAFLAFVARSDRQGVEHRFRDFLTFAFGVENVLPAARRLLGRRRRRPSERAPADRRTLLLELGVVAVSLLALIASARFLVAEAVWLARLLALPENLIGLSLIAVGTSLPELIVAISAARRGKAEILVGNVIGSNIANTWLILGLAATLRPLEISELSVVYTIPIMLFFSIGLLYFVRSDWRMRRRDGLLALLGYAAFLTTAFLQGWE
jgi:cation:H+ antiporter